MTQCHQLLFAGILGSNFYFCNKLMKKSWSQIVCNGWWACQDKAQTHLFWNFDSSSCEGILNHSQVGIITSIKLLPYICKLAFNLFMHFMINLFLLIGSLITWLSCGSYLACLCFDILAWMYRAKRCQGANPPKRFQSLWSWWLLLCPTADAKFVAKKNTPNKFSRSHEFIATPLLVLSGSNCLNCAAIQRF